MLFQHEMDHFKGSFVPKTRPDNIRCLFGKQKVAECREGKGVQI
jgi:hypothetical protein